jgi:amino-acid N-acetyltransferase
MNSGATAIGGKPDRSIALALIAQAALPASDLTDAHMEDFFYSGPASMPSGLVGLEFCGFDALLRSLVVVPERRGSGIGTALVRHAESYARGCGTRLMYLLTTTAQAFFVELGYVTADRASAPPAIRATREFADLCPGTSILLVKKL